MFCFDGNNSLKRIAKIGSRRTADTREFADSDYFLPRMFVDQFSHEVKSSGPRHHKATLETDLPIGDNNDGQLYNGAEDSEDGDPTDGASSDPAVKTCTQNWKAAAANSKKRMWDVFDETGIFASACRHHIILWIADMVRSGEL